MDYRSLRRRQRGFTLIELLIVVAIIGLIAAVAIPNLMNALDNARQKTAVADIRQIANAVEMYQVNVTHYPIVTALGSIESVGARSLGLEPQFMTHVPTRDPWKGFYYYASDGAGEGSDYTLISYGKDKKPSPSSQGVINSFDCDIIFQNNAFISYPEGIQN